MRRTFSPAPGLLVLLLVSSVDAGEPLACFSLFAACVTSEFKDQEEAAAEAEPPRNQLRLLLPAVRPSRLFDSCPF